MNLLKSTKGNSMIWITIVMFIMIAMVVQVVVPSTMEAMSGWKTDSAISYLDNLHYYVAAGAPYNVPGDLNPSLDDTFDLGSDSLTWNRIFVGSGGHQLTGGDATYMYLRNLADTDYSGLKLKALMLERAGDLEINNPWLGFRRARDTTASPTVLIDGDNIMSLFAQGYDGVQYRDAARILYEVDGTPGVGDMPGRIVFETTPDGGISVIEAMRIDSDQNTTFSGTVDLNVNNITRVANLNLNDAAELTISAGGAITVTQSYHRVDTISNNSTDDLGTVSGGVAGDMLFLRAEHADRTVVCKDASGNLQLNGDFSLDNTQDVIHLLNDGSDWLEVSRSDNGS